MFEDRGPLAGPVRYTPQTPREDDVGGVQGAVGSHAASTSAPEEGWGTDDGAVLVSSSEDEDFAIQEVC